MPVVSQAQRRLMFAAAEGKVPGVSPSVGKEFVDASKGITGLPEHVSHASHPSHRPTSAMEAATGMARGKRKTRRGRRKHANQHANQHGGGPAIPHAPTASVPVSAQDHADRLEGAMAAGHHAEAKTHALNLAKALHALSARKSALSPMNPSPSGTQ